MVLDHRDRLAYVCRSQRAHESLVERFCDELGYRAVFFDAVDPLGHPVYHTNVALSVGDQVALAALSLVPDGQQRTRLRSTLEASGRAVVGLGADQVCAFAGNALEVTGAAGPVLVVSARGWASLRRRQRAVVEEHLAVLPVDIPTIELAGGSARCMLAGIHLTRRS
ncbi:arginine deiminase-related protein [Arsenicicoccus piscis]|uniref:Amidinotransferase n=1 Tax=Arsenicicoccus piscis TaxID=673954 RepID=A0ABQ6HTW6_9MICO|nr:hypothetical protein GCM10025862_17260 [Arsenicicoccus piscis]GMA21971.1 hypothetical protein GCM10025862_39920 [Arsenicicoccus piscis]